MNVIRSIRKLAPSLSDADLVLAARSGEAWAREALLQRHLAFAHRLSCLLLGPHAGAREVLEGAFGDCLKNLGELRDPSGFSQFVTCRVVRLSQKRLRRSRRRLRRERPDFLGFRSKQALHGESERAALTRFYECLEELGVEARLALLLRDVERLDLRDIASALRTSTAQARRWLLLAERRLRPLGADARVPALLLGDADALPIPLSEFERAQLYRRVEQQLEARVERRLWPWALGAATCTAALTVALVLRQRPVAAAEPALLMVPPSAAQSVELPDGSRARLSPGAQLRVNVADFEQVQLTLLSGRADFELDPSAGRRFLINAGDASVAPIGARLSLSIEARDPLTGDLTLEVSTSDGAAELWRRSDAPSIALGADETWSGRVRAVRPSETLEP
ncbi:MAG: FecR domain-containing protein [Polyangiaceae bacterium]